MDEKKITVRLPPELAEALERQVKSSGVDQSKIVRDALTKFLTGVDDCVPVEVKYRARFIRVLLQEKACDDVLLRKEVNGLCYLINDSESCDL